jgi:hypothetical protein
MKLLTLGALILAASTASAYATPAIRMMPAEQVADAPDQPDNQSTGNQAAPAQKESPSKKLSQTNGVIHPPATHDRSVVKPPGNTTGEAVIPPPGTPGGDQTVQPK